MEKSTQTPKGLEHSPDLASRPSVVTFEHSFFTRIEAPFFHVHPHTGEPVMCVSISNNQALLPFPGLKREFHLGPQDCQMLDLLAEGLKFVRGLKIGDALPKEVLTGEASWDLSPRHVLIAHQRVSMQLVNWLTGVDTLITDPDALIQLADDPATRKKVNEAFGEAAERLGIGRENRQEMLLYVKKLSNELAYIEALRDKFADVERMRDKVQKLRQLYSRERSVAQTIDQIGKLFIIAVNDFSTRFMEIDAQTGEIISVLRNLESQVLYIRDKRDDLHIRLMAWDELLQDWRKIDVGVSYQLVNELGRVYQFLAPRFMKVDDWVLMTKLQIRAQKMEDLKKKNRVLIW
jgi:hypothetical protein